MPPPPTFLSSSWQIMQLSTVAILSLHASICYIHGIDKDDIDEEKNENRPKCEYHFVRYNHKQTCASVMLDYPKSKTNSLKITFESHTPILITSFKILHQKMHIGMMGLIAKRDIKLSQK